MFLLMCVAVCVSVAPSKSLSMSSVDEVPPIVPLSHLNPYMTTWKCRVRIIGKSTPRTYANDRNSGRLASLYMMDETGQMQLTMFNEQLDESWEKFEIGSIYMISGCILKRARDMSSNCAFDMTWSKESRMELMNNQTSEETTQKQGK
jgi:ssDNA-binding replication factor A large subunit